MADLNQESQEMADLIARVNDDLRRFGRLTQETSDALAAGSMRRARELDQAGKKSAEALTQVAGAAMSSARAMYAGQKGAAAFNNALDNLSSAATAASTALALLAPGGIVVKGLLAGLALSAKALTEYTKAANRMADDLYKGYAGLARAGASASDGMTGVFEDAKKLGVSMNELDGYINLVGRSSRDLALFGGAVFDGRKRFAELGRTMEPFRESLLAAGITMEEQREGMMGYIRLQSRIGQAQNLSVTQLADGVRRYLIEQDALTKLTGETREEQEAAREEIRSQERFAGRMEQLRQQGRTKEAKALEDTFLILRSQNKKAAQGFADLTTNTVQTDAAQQALMGSMGESMRAGQQVAAGQMGAAQAAQRIAQAHGMTATRLGTTMAQLGIYNETFGDFAGDLKLRALAENDLNKVLQQITAEQQRSGLTGAEAADKVTRQQARLIDTQIAANIALERFVMRGVDEATAAMQMLADVTVAGGEGLNRLLDNMFGLTTQAPGTVGRGAAAGRMRRRRESEQEETDAESDTAPATTRRRRGGPSRGAETVTPQDRTTDQTSAAPGDTLQSRLGSASIREVVRAEPGVLIVKNATGEQTRREGGTRAWRNNNPGNIEYGAFARRQGAVGSDGRFAVFPSYAVGRNAKRELLFGRDSKYIDLTVAKAIARYAPDFENTTLEYSSRVAKAVGVPVNTKLRELTRQQRQAFIEAIQQQEGYSEGKVVKAADGGVFSGPKEGYPAVLHGDEAVVPLPDGKSIPVELGNDKIEELVRSITGDLLPKSNIGDEEFAREVAANLARNLIPEVRKAETLRNAFEDPTMQGLANVVGLLNPGVGRTLTQALQVTDAVQQESEALDKLLDIVSVLVPKFGILRKGFQHIQAMVPEEKMAKGGITQGPSLAGEAGPEAVVPLPDGKTIPVNMPNFGYGDLAVSIDGLNDRIKELTGSSQIRLKGDPMAPGGVGPSVGGYNAWRGINVGAMTTDLNAIKDIAGQLGAFDKATQTITNPETWQKILQSGIGTNMNVGGIDLGTRLGGSDIGIEIGDRVSEIMATKDTDLKTAIQEVTKEFNSAMAQVFETIKGQMDPQIQAQILQTLVSINQNQTRVADSNQRIADAAAN